MIARRFAITAVLMLTMCVCAHAQNTDIEQIITDMLEEMAADENLSEDGEEAAALLLSQAQNPINLNTATHAELERFFFLTEAKIAAILARRRVVGAFETPQELLTIKALTQTDVERLLLFAQINPDEQTKPAGTAVRGDVVARLQRAWPEARGYKSADGKEPPYLGQPYRTLVRANMSVGDRLTAGLVAENDAGEPMFSNGTTLTDYLSGFVMFRPQKGIVRQAIVGHYAAQYGQGLGMWTGFSSDYSSMYNSIDRRARGIVSTLSASEFGYLRGGAMSLKKEDFGLDLYVSYIDGDASTFVGADSVTYISSIKSDGLHRTLSERASRKNLGQLTTGGYLSYALMRLRVGLGYHRWQGSLPFGNDGQLYKLYYPRGKEINTVHTDYRFLGGKISAYGEMVWQDMKTFAAMQAFDIALGNGNYLTVSYRKFGKRYYPINQNPFSRSSKPGGESGFYAGLSLAPFRRFALTANVNIYKNDWVQYQKNFLTSGYKCRATATYSPTRNSTLVAKIRHDGYDENKEDDSGVIARAHRTSTRLQWATRTSDRLRLTTTVEKVWYGQDGGNNYDGFWIGQSVKYSAERPRIDISLLLAHFDTEDYDCRIYASQPDVLYSMSIPSYSNNGIVAVACAKWEITRNINIWLWGNYMKYYDRDEVGSSYNTIYASHKFEAKCQVQVKFWKYVKHRTVE